MFYTFRSSTNTYICIPPSDPRLQKHCKYLPHFFWGGGFPFIMSWTYTMIDEKICLINFLLAAFSSWISSKWKAGVPGIVPFQKNEQNFSSFHLIGNWANL